MVRLETVKGTSAISGKLNRYKENVSPTSNATVDPYDAEAQVLDFERLVPVLKTKQAGLKKANGRFQPLKRSPPLSENRRIANMTVSEPAEQLSVNPPNPPAKRKSHDDFIAPSPIASSLSCPPPKRASGGTKDTAKDREPAAPKAVKTLEPAKPFAVPKAMEEASGFHKRLRHEPLEKSKLKMSGESHHKEVKKNEPRSREMVKKVLRTPGSLSRPNKLWESPQILEPLKILANVPTALMKMLEETPAKSSSSQQHHCHNYHHHTDSDNDQRMLAYLTPRQNSRNNKAKILISSRSKGTERTKPIKPTEKAKLRFVAQYQVFTSKDMLLSIARFLPGLELARLSLSNVRIQFWLCDPNHRLWQNLCVANYGKFRTSKRDEDSWKRRYLQSLEICEACDLLRPAGFPGAVMACINCKVQYCGFNPPSGHVRFPTTPATKTAPRRVGMCYEQCWALCWRCNDLIVMQLGSGETGAVCRSCCPPDREVCEQCREALLLAYTKAQWEVRRNEHRVARVLGLADPTMGEFVEIDDDGRSVASHYSGRHERMAPEESLLDTSGMFDPYF